MSFLTPTQSFCFWLDSQSAKDSTNNRIANLSRFSGILPKRPDMVKNGKIVLRFNDAEQIITNNFASIHAFSSF